MSEEIKLKDKDKQDDNDDEIDLEALRNEESSSSVYQTLQLLRKKQKEMIASKE